MGIIDGTHINCTIPDKYKGAYANRKKRFTINNMIIVDLDGFVNYV
jgi:hypothetical protein